MQAIFHVRSTQSYTPSIPTECPLLQNQIYPVYVEQGQWLQTFFSGGWFWIHSSRVERCTQIRDVSVEVSPETSTLALTGSWYDQNVPVSSFGVSLCDAGMNLTHSKLQVFRR